MHADWSIDPAKRWLTIATPQTDRWLVSAPEPVGAPETLLQRLRARARGAPIAFGVDCPLGLPRAYAAMRPEPNFPTFLRALAGHPTFFDPAETLGDVAHARPFYPARPRAGMTRLSHATALGLADAAALSRTCDRATANRPAGAPLFWTLGANQSGKAAISFWRDLLIPALAAPNAPRLWPFDGALLPLGPNTITIAETYPAEAMRHLAIQPAGSKRRQSDRAAYAPAVRAAMQTLAVRPTDALLASLHTGFGPDRAAEDRLDCLLGALCIINVLRGRRAGTAPNDPWIMGWEGWVLGQTCPA